MNGADVDGPPGPPPRWSPLALAALVLSVLPLGSLLAPPLGLAALLQLRARPDLRGRGLAWAGIAVGIVASSLMVGGAWLTWREFERLAGRPAAALAAAWAGDAPTFRAQMSAPGREASAEALAAWTGPLRARLGEFRGCRMSSKPPPAPTTPLPETEIRAAFECDFSAAAGPVPATVTFDRPSAGAGIDSGRVRRFEFLLADGTRIVFPPDDEQPAANAPAPRPAGR